LRLGQIFANPVCPPVPENKQISRENKRFQVPTEGKHGRQTLAPCRNELRVQSEQGTRDSIGTSSNDRRTPSPFGTPVTEQQQSSKPNSKTRSKPVFTIQKRFNNLNVAGDPKKGLLHLEFRLPIERARRAEQKSPGGGKEALYFLAFYDQERPTHQPRPQDKERGDVKASGAGGRRQVGAESGFRGMGARGQGAGRRWSRRRKRTEGKESSRDMDGRSRGGGGGGGSKKQGAWCGR
jgi:hypothetical protein